MGVFSNIKEAHGTRGGLYLKPGKYTLQVLRCKLIESFRKDPTFVAELRVVTSEKNSEDEPLAPGSEPSFVINMNGKFPELALGNVADFMRAGLASLADQHNESRPSDISGVEVDEAVASAVSGEDNLLAGVYVTANAFNKKTREGNDFTRITWDVPDNLAELVGASAQQTQPQQQQQ
jgi:hypothetical protein